jgi:hypothetical protein
MGTGGYCLDTFFRYTQGTRVYVFKNTSMQSKEGTRSPEKQPKKETTRATESTPESVATPNVIRPELNIEKWPAIWRPSHSKRTPAVRELQRDITLANGVRVTARVELGFTHLGELTTEDQKTYYALVKQWEANGRSAQQTFFSIRGLARFLNKKWGTNVIDSITESLRRLRTAPFTWQNAYHDGVTKDIIQEIDIFTILSELKIIRQKSDGRVTREAGYFRFNDLTLKNLFAHHTKPVLFDTILRFRSEIAQLVYTHIDLVMADKRHYERRTRELFADLGLRGTKYARLYERKGILERALLELRGVPVSTGIITDAVIEKTQDKTDYKVCFTKASRHFRMAVVQTPRSDAAPFLSGSKSAIESQAHELVLHFHKLFHNVNRVYPQSKEVNQAISLIAQYGFGQAKYVIDFSHQAAAKTTYHPQTLGGILQYTAQAVAAYERNEREAAAAATASARASERRNWDELQRKLQEVRYREGSAKLEKMPDEQRQALYTKVKDDLIARRPWLASSTSTMFERTLRAAMITELLEHPTGEEGDCNA